MLTPTHTLIGATLIPRRAGWKMALSALSGGLMPDINMYVMVAWAALVSVPAEVLWGVWYFSDFWKFWDGIFNAFFLYFSLLVLGLVFKRPVIWIFAGAALLHLIFDFPVHREDAHAHFLPLTDWHFVSPVSYWDAAHFAKWVVLFEILGAGALIVYLALKHHTWWAWGPLAGMALAYAVLAWFALTRYFGFV